MDNEEPFWKNALRKIEDLLNNPIKLKNEDLLVELTEDLSPVSIKKSMKPRFIAKPSDFNKKYTNYKPDIVEVLEGSKRLMKTRRYVNRTPSPYFRVKQTSFFKDRGASGTLHGKFGGSFSKVGFFQLPKISKSGRVDKSSVKMRNEEKNGKIFIINN